ncbi:MAG TPA: DUF2071 domain-containing protein [Pyrinomonadaceae bacterium]|nr:DUF2071 domain-containing protein [Pyrinomonadaceae bacterium]
MTNKDPAGLDRLAPRRRPEGQPLMHQSWGKLLFMHWRIDNAQLRPLIPAELEIDAFDGSAWIAVVPFTIWDTRALPPYIPTLPGLSAMHELNVRTYVVRDRVPGVWFFSLDCNSRAAVLGARSFFHLPYYNADIELKQEADAIDYSLLRRGEPAAKFHGRWTIGEALPVSRLSQPDSLEFFLTERYCLYSVHAGKLYRGRIHHQPWPLRKAALWSFSSTMIEAHGLGTPSEAPLLHYAEELTVDIWALRRVL